MNTRAVWGILVVVAGCSSKPGVVEAPSGTGESFLTQVYAPPVPPEVRCAGGVPVKLAPEWHSIKPDDGVSPAEVYVHLDGAPHTCTIEIGPFPRICKESDGWTTTCTNRDGSRPHVGQLRCSPGTLEVWVIAPEGEFRVAELSRPAGSPPCNGT